MSPCDCRFKLKDSDLPPASRTLANMWQLKYLETLRELANAHRGIRRLKAQNTRLRAPRAEPTRAALPPMGA